MAKPHTVTPVRWQGARNAWTRLTWPIRRRIRRLPDHAAPTYLEGIDEEGWLIESRGPSGVVVRGSTDDRTT
jgi:hypothetical protein